MEIILAIGFCLLIGALVCGAAYAMTYPLFRLDDPEPDDPHRDTTGYRGPRHDG